MAQRLRFVLDGDDQLSPVLNGAGDASARLNRRLNDDMRGNTTAVRGFTQDASGRLRDLQGRFLSAADAQRALAGGLPDLTRRLGDVTSAGGDAAASLGKSGGGLGGVMATVAGIAGASLLPAIGALVPMMAGTALTAGTLKLGFSGVGEAMKAAGEGKEEYEKALKKLSPEARSFTRELVDMKKEFSGVGNDIQKAMLPGFTRALKDAAPVAKILRGEMVDLGSAFGDSARGLGRMMKDSGFQDDFRTNLQLGSQFVRDMTSAMGPFTRSLLDFGAASKPTLDAFSDGLSGLLAKGLPGMFEGLESGIGGSAKLLDGLFTGINDLLPALGRMSGAFADTFGPAVGESMRFLGAVGAGAMDALAAGARIAKPIFNDLAFGLKTVTDLGKIIGPTMADVGGAILGGLSPAADAVSRTAGPFERLNRVVQENKIGIMEASRFFGNAVIDMAGAAIQNTPIVIAAFRTMANLALTAVGTMIGGLAKAFGDVPVIGEKLKDAASGFETYKGKFVGALDAAQEKAESFAAESLPKLERGKLKMNINNWNQQITAAREKLKTVPPSKQSALKGHIADLQAKVEAAKRKLREPKDRTVSVKGVDKASSIINSIRNQLNNINGKVAKTYVDVIQRGGSVMANSMLGSKGATGGLFTGRGFRHRGRGYSTGGLVDGPGTETSDDVWAPWLSKNEFVVNARQTAKYLPLLRAINSGAFASGFLAPGGGGALAGAGLDVGKGLIKGMDDSRAGVLAAAHRMTAEVEAGIRAEAQIASPSKKTKALAQDIANGLVDGLTGSQAQIKATAKDLAEDIWKAFDGAKDNKYVRMVNEQTAKLLSLAKKRDAVAAKIAEARKYAADTTTAAKTGAGLANLGLEPEQVTAGSIKAGLASKLSQIRMFTRYIDILAKKGLSKGLLRQIIDMGPEAGYAYASALVGADKATFNQINDLQSQIDKSSTNLGRVAADGLYDSGKNASKGFLAGLLSQEKELEKAMEKIAKSMEKALKKALGIKSPARKMMPDGVMTTRGVAAGVIEGLPYLDQAMQAVAGRVTGTAIGAPAVGRPAARAVLPAGGQQITANISITDALDPVAVAREVQRLLLQLGRAQGMKVSLNLGGV